MTQPPNSVKHDLNDKASLRKELIQKRKETDKDLRMHWDEQICMHLTSLLSSLDLPKKNIGVFSAIQAEPNLTQAYIKLHDLSAQLALPIVIAKKKPLAFAMWSPGDAMTKDSFGIPIPTVCKIITPEVLIIPCVGFNKNGYRLGYGGGFYDRTLAQILRPLAIGIAYQNNQVLFEENTFDIRMDFIITNQGIHQFNT